MEQPPLPDFDAINARMREDATRKREGLIRRLTGFLEQEAAGDENHPATQAKRALETGSDREVIAYLKSEIDKVTEAKKGSTDESALEEMEERRGELMRWKVSLSSNGN